MFKSRSSILSVLVLGGALGASAFAQNGQSTQTSSATSDQAAGQTSAQTPSTVNPNDSSTYATGKPLEMQSKEGFWGHMNPLARKKWVRRQVGPLQDRTNELDQLQAKNRNDIRDVDSRATAGISKAMTAAQAADQRAQDAANKASGAQDTATNASTRTDALNTTVGSLDQYQQVSSTAVNFVPGRAALTTKAKASLDQVADTLSAEKGYIIEVQGYSRKGVASSQAMADAVTRYLVTDHQVPIYRIYRTGLGRPSAKNVSAGDKMIANGVRVTLLHNSLATMNTNTAQNTAPASTGATGAAGGYGSTGSTGYSSKSANTNSGITNTNSGNANTNSGTMNTNTGTTGTYGTNSGTMGTNGGSTPAANGVNPDSTLNPATTDSTIPTTGNSTPSMGSTPATGTSTPR